MVTGGAGRIGPVICATFARGGAYVGVVDIAANRTAPPRLLVNAHGISPNRIERPWRSLWPAVTHTHRRETLPPLLEDADSWARTISPMEIMRQIGSPFADTVDPTDHQAIAHAA